MKKNNSTSRERKPHRRKTTAVDSVKSHQRTLVTARLHSSARIWVETLPSTPWSTMVDQAHFFMHGREMDIGWPFVALQSFNFMTTLSENDSTFLLQLDERNLPCPREENEKTPTKPKHWKRYRSWSSDTNYALSLLTCLHLSRNCSSALWSATVDQDHSYKYGREMSRH